MEMPKASDADKERFRSVVPDRPDVVVKPMFGNLGAFVNGNMFAGLFGPVIGVKLDEADRVELESTERTVPFGPAERPDGRLRRIAGGVERRGRRRPRPGPCLGGEGAGPRRNPAAQGTKGTQAQGRQEVACRAAMNPPDGSGGPGALLIRPAGGIQNVLESLQGCFEALLARE